MTLPCTGPLSISQIKAEMGSSSNDIKQLCIEAGLGAPYSISRFHCYSHGSITPPTATPGNLAVVDKQDCANPYSAQATWVNNDPISTLHIQWYVNGVLAAEYDLSASTTSNWYGGPDAGVVCGDDLYCKLWYTNSAGTGPVATSNTVHLNVDPCTGTQTCA